MDTIVARHADQGRVGGPDRSSDQSADAIQRLGAWMMILGTVRLLFEAGEYSTAFLAMAGRGALSRDMVGRFLQEYSLPVLLVMSWPLLMGLILRRSGSRAYLGAAAVTFLVLGLGSVLHIVEGLFLRYESTVVLGSFSVLRFGLDRLVAGELFRASLGAIQVTLELATGLYALHLAIRLGGRDPSELAAPGATRRRLHGRLALYVSLAFLFVGMRLPFWTAYVEVLNRSTLVRDFMLRTAPPPQRAGRERPYRLAPRNEHETVLANAARLASLGRVPDSNRVYRDVIATVDSKGISDRENPMKEVLARSLNNLAWALATCEDVSLRNPTESVALARRAVDMIPDEGTYWNTLGAAYIRMRNWEQAGKALEKSMALRDPGDSFDWFLMAIVDTEKGDRAHGRAWYDRAVAWFRESRPGDPELFRFQLEAARSLSLPQPSPPDLSKLPPSPRRAPEALPHRADRRRPTAPGQGVVR